MKKQAHPRNSRSGQLVAIDDDLWEQIDRWREPSALPRAEAVRELIELGLIFKEPNRES